DARPALLRVLGEHLGFDVAELWEVDAATHDLFSAEMWAREGLDVTSLQNDDEHARWVCQSVAQETRRQRRIVWTPGVRGPAAPPGLPALRVLGLTSALGVPLLVGPAVLGVIQLYRRDSAMPAAEARDVLAVIGNLIGQFLIRKQSEGALRATHDHLRALV